MKLPPCYLLLGTKFHNSQIKLTEVNIFQYIFHEVMQVNQRYKKRPLFSFASPNSSQIYFQFAIFILAEA